MSVKKELSGRRSVQVEVEVPGTPEEVWQTIATGPGVSAWFVPTTVDPREGGLVTASFGPGMETSATINAWEPPHRFAAECNMGPGAPPFATEWIVQARDGGTCVVRVVHSLFASTDDWDNQLESTESGWPAFFLILRLYLTHFRGQPCSAFRALAISSESQVKVWSTLTGALGIAGATAGQPCRPAVDVPPIAGVVEKIREGHQPYQLLLLDEPAPGAAFLNACSMGGQVFLNLSFYFYGERAADAVARDEPLWREWMNRQFPSTANTGAGAGA